MEMRRNFCIGRWFEGSLGKHLLGRELWQELNRVAVSWCLEHCSNCKYSGTFECQSCVNGMQKKKQNLEVIFMQRASKIESGFSVWNLENNSELKKLVLWPVEACWYSSCPLCSIKIPFELWCCIYLWSQGGNFGECIWHPGILLISLIKAWQHFRSFNWSAFPNINPKPAHAASTGCNWW